jgi:hypothetical protein
MSYLDNGAIRLGIDLDVGGAITYLAPTGGQNLVNSFDLGRQIQMSYYAGPVPYTPGGKQPPKPWLHIGWNPIQSGDCFGHRSRVIEFRNDGRELYCKCIPMQWPLDNEPGECTFECWFTLSGTTVQARCRFDNHRADTTQYQARMQELPAVYTNGPWYRLFTYTGDRPFSGGELTRIEKRPQDPGPWVSWRATENWAALVDDANRGLGIWQPECYEFSGGFAGRPGQGGPQDDPTGYIAPNQIEILDHNIGHEYRYTLVVGTLDEIRRYVYDQPRRPPLPDDRFTADRQHWYLVNARDQGWPIRDSWQVTLDKDDPYLVGPAGLWPAADVPKLYIEAACSSRSAGPAQIFWQTHAEPNFSESNRLSFPLHTDGQWHTYEVDLASHPGYRGSITRLRFDPVPGGTAGDFIKIRSISAQKPAADATP